MSKNTLELLFNSKARVKILKLLFHNASSRFSVKEISNRVQEEPALVAKEMRQFSEIGLVKKIT